MGRHWQNIKLSKGKLDAQRGARFTQASRAITLAAREKGGDPEMNTALRIAIEKAKAVNMPKDNIERAIKRGTGELAGDVIERLTYEGYGPGGAAVLVEAATDNRNRTAGEIRHLFSKHGGNLGQDGSVAWMFERKGILLVPAPALEGKDPDETELALIDAGAEDVRREEGGLLVIVPPESLQASRDAVLAAGFPVESAEFGYLPKDRVPLAPAHEGLEELLDALEENEDIQAVHTNVDL